MARVNIVLVRCSEANARVWGEVKATNEPGRPTIAHAEVTERHADVFEAERGTYSYHFRVTPRCRLTLSAEVDGRVVGPEVDYDAGQITAGHRYFFEVQ